MRLANVNTKWLLISWYSDCCWILILSLFHRVQSHFVRLFSHITVSVKILLIITIRLPCYSMVRSSLNTNTIYIPFMCKDNFLSFFFLLLLFIIQCTLFCRLCLLVLFCLLFLVRFFVVVAIPQTNKCQTKERTISHFIKLLVFAIQTWFFFCSLARSPIYLFFLLASLSIPSCGCAGPHTKAKEIIFH